MPRVKLAHGIEREIIEDMIPEANKKKRGRPPGSKNVKSSKKVSSKKSKNQTEAVDGGKSYYCNGTTGVTQRTVPQGKDVKILTQDEAEVLQKKIQESGAPSKDDGEDDGQGFQEEIQESGAASKDYGDKDGEDLQEEKRPGEDHEPTCDWSELKESRVAEFQQYTQHQVHNEQGHSGMPRNDGVPLNLPSQGQLIQTRPSGVQRVLSHPAQGRSGRPLSAQDQQALSHDSSGQSAQYQALLTQGQQLLPSATTRGHQQALLTQGHQLLPAATTRGHHQAPLNLGQRSFPPAIQGQLIQSLPSLGQQNQPPNIKIKVEIEMSTEQFITVGQALFRHRHQNN